MGILSEHGKRVDYICNVMNKKPLDVGCGSLSASITPDGRVLSINCYQEHHGFVTLSSIEQFPNDRWYDSDFVRQYRRKIAGEAKNIRHDSVPFGFGLTPMSSVSEVKSGFLDTSNPFFEMILADGLKVHSAFYAIKRSDGDYLVNQVEVVNEFPQDKIFSFNFGGAFHLHRCGYGQLTEGGPIPVPDPLNEVTAAGNYMSVISPALGMRCEISLFIENDTVSFSSFSNESIRPILFQHHGETKIPSGKSRQFCVVYSLDSDTSNKKMAMHTEICNKVFSNGLFFTPNGEKCSSQSDEAFPSPYVIARNVDYIISCCSVPVSNRTVAIITDHQLLPLSWNRDSYYMVHLLLTVAKGSLPNDVVKNLGNGTSTFQIQQLVRKHILWMFRGTKLSDGYWGRSYLANGFCKDKIYQLDQQCYPFLELRDYLTVFDDEEIIQEISTEIRQALINLLSRKLNGRYLFPTSETPADDRVNLPYHFSSHVLLWHTLQQLSLLSDKYLNFAAAVKDVCENSLGKFADFVRKECLDTFSVFYDGKPMFSYLSDGKELTRVYHDANDLPVVLAPLWGFIDRADERWLNTMRFSFSAQNKDGYFSGTFEGLGSTHTPHPWPLGYAQELLFGHLTENNQLKNHALEKLKNVQMCDGLFSEAVNEDTGLVESRTWFSWPGAFISDVLLSSFNKGFWL